jgi:GWxTD domain-containing protein
MKKLILTFLLCLISLGGSVDNYQQVIMQDGKFGEKIPTMMPIVFRAYPVAINQHEFNVYFIAEVVYDFMQFLLKEDQYQAEMEFEVVLKHTQTNKIFSKSWRSSLLVDNFYDTNKRNKLFLSIDSITVSPGSYEVKVIYRDLQGKQRQEFPLKLILPEINQFYASPPLFCSFENESATYPPLFQKKPHAMRQHLLFNEQTGIFFKIWNSKESEINLNFSFFQQNSKKPIFTKDTLLTIVNDQSKALIQLPSIEWEEGKYSLSVVYKAGNDSIQQKMPITIIWFDQPLSLHRFDYAVRPLELILSEDEYKLLTSGKKDKRIDAFKQYWKTKDPSPGTAFNEVLIEFYNRVDSVDQKWSRKGDHQYGWRTDPGKIYILYGKPDEIEDSSLDPTDPHMKWIYYMNDRQMIFKFASLDGRKRYRLIEESEVSNP